MPPKRAQDVYIMPYQRRCNVMWRCLNVTCLLGGWWRNARLWRQQCGYVLLLQDICEISVCSSMLWQAKPIEMNKYQFLSSIWHHVWNNSNTFFCLIPMSKVQSVHGTDWLTVFLKFVTITKTSPFHPLWLNLNHETVCNCLITPHQSLFFLQTFLPAFCMIICFEIKIKID